MPKISVLPQSKVAKLLGISSMTLYRIRPEKVGPESVPLPYLKIGGKVFYRMDDIEKYLKLVRRG